MEISDLLMEIHSMKEGWRFALTMHGGLYVGRIIRTTDGQQLTVM